MLEGVHRAARWRTRGLGAEIVIVKFQFDISRDFDIAISKKGSAASEGVVGAIGNPERTSFVVKFGFTGHWYEEKGLCDCGAGLNGHRLARGLKRVECRAREARGAVGDFVFDPVEADDNREGRRRIGELVIPEGHLGEMIAKGFGTREQARSIKTGAPNHVDLEGGFSKDVSRTDLGDRGTCDYIVNAATFVIRLGLTPEQKCYRTDHTQPGQPLLPHCSLMRHTVCLPSEESWEKYRILSTYES